MYQKILPLFSLLFFLGANFSVAQNITLSGTVSDAQNGETLIGASVLEATTANSTKGIGTTTKLK